MNLPVRRQERPFGTWEWVTLAAYAVVAGVGVHLHQSWAGEAQDWLTARDTTLGGLLERLHYEGAPTLWHLILWTLAHAGFTFGAVQWVCAGIATVGLAVWLRHSPMPRYLKLVFPFTFYMAYQYAAMVSGYVLFPLLVFTACGLIGSLDVKGNRVPRPVATALALGLLANLSLYGWMCAVGLALVYGERCWRMDCVLLQGGRHKRRCWAGAGLLAVMLAVAAATAWPAQDVAFIASIKQLPSVQAMLDMKQPAINNGGGRQTSWFVIERAAPGERPPAGAAWQQSLWRSCRLGTGAAHPYRTRKMLYAVSLLLFPLSTFSVLAYLVVATLIYRCTWHRFRTSWLPYALVFMGCMTVFCTERIAGLLMIALMAVAWVSWQQRLPLRRTPRWMEMLLRASLATVLVVQVGWTAHALWSEAHQAYSGDRMAARYLQESARGKRVAGFYSLAAGPELYFDRKIYFNQPTSYWPFSMDARMNLSQSQVLAARPDYVVIGTRGYLQDVVLNQVATVMNTSGNWPGDLQRIGDYFEAHGYRETHRFCGVTPMRGGYNNKLCQVILEPAQ